MADPQLPGIVRVHVIQHSASLLPRDNVVNSWAFRNDNYDSSIQFGTTPEQRTSLANALKVFYDAIPQKAITSNFTTALTIKGYDLAQPAGVRSGNTWVSDPREPWQEDRVTLRPTTGGQLPEEAAVVLTLAGLRNLPRQRGRIYLGPFSTNIGGIQDGRVMVDGVHRQAILDAFSTMRATLLAAGWTVGIVSQVNTAFVETRQAWIDNAFDTQRRRGPRPTSRVSWAAVGD